ncbi:L-fucose/L-arabinose isomerase family protein [candidate division KSB1 bacterium]|nr:L-fucose/L-arabinose isomerase family protein [candidate division KSB1 bacterium]
MLKKVTLGVIVGNRGFFPDKLVETGRVEILELLKKKNIETVCLSPGDTNLGGVETYDDAKKCAALFKTHAEVIDGILITLPNFGDEKAIANTLKLSELEVPILIHAFPDNPNAMQLDSRRDSFCGKLSACNNLYQYNIPFSLTTQHTAAPDDPSFHDDLDWFTAVCRIFKGLTSARIGAIGARTSAFNTVRFSEKLLEADGISVETIDLYEVFGRVGKLRKDDPDVRRKLKELKSYCSVAGVPEAALLKMARFGVVVDQWIAENELNATAIQCWTALEDYFGIVPCAVMSMLSNNLLPSACEVDVTGALAMYALQLASGVPSALVDWNNNYGNELEKAVFFHCSNFPKSVFNETRMVYQDIIAGSVGKENSYGTCVGRLKSGPFTFARISTDDTQGIIKAYVGEGDITDDPLDTFGGFGVVRIPHLQTLLNFICTNGFEHHVAISPSMVAHSLVEVFDNYLGWEVYFHEAS